jgi:regulator of cell morphogenesis and NO signaling
VRSELPEIRALLDKAMAAQNREYGEVLSEMGRQLSAFRSRIEEHLAAEEDELFPYWEELIEAAEDESTPPPRPDILGEGVQEEHEDVLEELERLIGITGGYRLPDDADEAFCDFDDRITRLEMRLSRHIELEEQVLFPRLLELEEMLFEDETE